MIVYVLMEREMGGMYEDSYEYNNLIGVYDSFEKAKSAAFAEDFSKIDPKDIIRELKAETKDYLDFDVAEYYSDTSVRYIETEENYSTLYDYYIIEREVE